jgi:hypothetical protein
MSRFYIPISLLILFTMAGCGPTIFISPNFQQARKQHKTLAILPFDVLIGTTKLPKNVTKDMVLQQQEETGYSLQSNVYTYFLNEQKKNKYTIDFQDIDKTNALLKKAGISYDDLNGQTKEELCNLLGVDAIMSSRATMEKPMSDGGAIALGVLFGFWGSTNRVDVNVNIHDKNDSKLLWKYDYQASGSVGSSTEQLSKALMRNISKKFPYRKE